MRHLQLIVVGLVLLSFTEARDGDFVALPDGNQRAAATADKPTQIQQILAASANAGVGGQG